MTTFLAHNSPLLYSTIGALAGSFIPTIFLILQWLEDKQESYNDRQLDNLLPLIKAVFEEEMAEKHLLERLLRENADIHDANAMELVKQTPEYETILEHCQLARYSATFARVFGDKPGLGDALASCFRIDAILFMLKNTAIEAHNTADREDKRLVINNCIERLYHERMHILHPHIKDLSESIKSRLARSIYRKT